MNPVHDDAFYVGYLPRAPRPLARFVTRVVVLLGASGVALAFALVLSQASFSAARFEYGVIRTFEGVLRRQPVPSLEVTAPGGGRVVLLLVGVGKHGADPLFAGIWERRVLLQGSLVHRDDQTMLEVAPGGVQDLGPAPVVEAANEDLGVRTIRGEIVDSKCYLGVMKPGHLKPHRACAVRCISGGVPPVLLVRNDEGLATYFLLVGREGEPIGTRVLDFVAEPVEVTGRLRRMEDLMVLSADPSSIRRLER